MTLVDQGTKRAPEQTRDVFWDNDHIAPLYSLDAAKRTVHPLHGSSSMIKWEGRSSAFKTLFTLKFGEKREKRDDGTAQKQIESDGRTNTAGAHSRCGRGAAQHQARQRGEAGEVGR